MLLKKELNGKECVIQSSPIPDFNVINRRYIDVTTNVVEFDRRTDIDTFYRNVAIWGTRVSFLQWISKFQRIRLGIVLPVIMSVLNP